MPGLETYRFNLAKTVLSLLLLFATVVAHADHSITLRNSQWHLISFPVQTSEQTFADLLGDELDVSRYVDRWVLYEYSALDGQYTRVDLASVPQTGRAYWITQSTGMDVTIDVPEGIADADASRPSQACSPSLLCV